MIDKDLIKKGYQIYGITSGHDISSGYVPAFSTATVSFLPEPGNPITIDQVPFTPSTKGRPPKTKRRINNKKKKKGYPYERFKK